MQNPRSISDWLQMGLWIGVAVASVAAAMGIAWVLLFRSSSSGCLDAWAIGDPSPHAMLFLAQADAEGLLVFDERLGVQEWGWYFTGSEVEFMIVIDGERWSSVPCYLPDTVTFPEIERRLADPGPTPATAGFSE